MKRVDIFTDGACRGNPGPGGYGIILRSGSHEKELSGFDPDTTNNRMELTAAIEALKALQKPCEATVTTDSQYVCEGMSRWISGWKSNGWKNANRKPVKNRELWMALDSLCGRHRVQWKWIRGHSGHPENERCDELANLAIDCRRPKS
jgi:ribonuclease HI